MEEHSREQSLWQELADEAGEDLIEAAAAVSVEQAEKELREAGFDVDAERARAESFLLWLEGKSAAAVAVEEAAVAPSAPMVAEAVPQDAPPERAHAARTEKAPRRKARPAVVWLAAAAVVTAGAAIAYVETRPEEAPPPAPAPTPTVTPAPPPPSLDLVAAADLRHRAAAACDANRPTECLTLLDEAAAKDPAGDAMPEVARLRERALHTLQAKPK
jgi:hypothetical protein